MTPEQQKIESFLQLISTQKFYDWYIEKEYADWISGNYDPADKNKLTKEIKEEVRNLLIIYNLL